jgi:hypothetical protein
LNQEPKPVVEAVAKTAEKKKAKESASSDKKETQSPAPERYGLVILGSAPLPSENHVVFGRKEFTIPKKEERLKKSDKSSKKKFILC